MSFVSVLSGWIWFSAVQTVFKFTLENYFVLQKFLLCFAFQIHLKKYILKIISYKINVLTFHQNNHKVVGGGSGGAMQANTGIARTLVARLSLLGALINFFLSYVL